MRSRLGIFFGALALLQILGGHWALLQTSAWVGMIVQYSQRSGLKAGITQTFDGETPVLQTEVKKDYLAPWNRFQLHQGWVEVKYPRSGEQHESVAFEPAVLPPRSAQPLAVGF